MSAKQRDELIGKVERGELSPPDAEAAARQLNLKPIESRPDMNVDRSLKEPFWSLPMAVAWIAYRTEAAVAEWWSDYRVQCWDWRFRDAWVKPGLSGWRLIQGSPGSLAALHFRASFDDADDRDPEFSMTTSDAQAALWSALQASCFEATGVNAASGTRETISAMHWRDLSCFEEQGRDLVRSELKPDQSWLRFTDVVVPSGHLRGIWPKRPPPPERLTLPATARPDGGGYMPLFSAALWIATEGGTVDFDPTELDRWKPTYAALLARISSDEVTVSGLQRGQRDVIAGVHFAGIAVAYPYQDTQIELIFSEALYLHSSPYFGEEKWRDGWNDVLENRSHKKFTHLMVKSTDIASLWPFDYQPHGRTGAPGRPTSRQLVELEFGRRRSTGETLGSIGAESEALSHWLQENHRKQPQMKPVTIANAIRSAFNTTPDARN